MFLLVSFSAKLGLDSSGDKFHAKHNFLGRTINEGHAIPNLNCGFVRADKGPVQKS